MDIFYGRVTDNMAHVYVRALRHGPQDARTLSGTIRGPFCELSHTLPATINFKDMGAGPTLLGAAAVPDPCCWSPQLPATYDVQVELHDQKQLVQTLDQTIGIRRLGVTGRSLFWEGKRWVLRGVAGPASLDAQPSDDEVWSTIREASAAIYVLNPSGRLCDMASRAGVVVMARLSDPGNIAGQLEELGRYGAVIAAVLPAEFRGSKKEVRDAAPNLLLAQSCRDQVALKVEEWSDLIVLQVSEPTRFHQAANNCPLPIVAHRRLNEMMPVGIARAQCDQLQRDLAPGGDYAGYLVT